MGSIKYAVVLKLLILTDRIGERRRRRANLVAECGSEVSSCNYGVFHAKIRQVAENYITQGVVGIFGCNEGSTTGAGNAIKASGKDNVIGVGFDKSDAILGLIDDGYLLCTMAQNPDVMGYEGVKAAVKAINGESLGGAVTDTGVSVLTKQQ